MSSTSIHLTATRIRGVRLEHEQVEVKVEVKKLSWCRYRCYPEDEKQRDGGAGASGPGMGWLVRKLAEDGGVARDVPSGCGDICGLRQLRTKTVPLHTDYSTSVWSAVYPREKTAQRKAVCFRTFSAIERGNGGESVRENR